MPVVGQTSGEGRAIVERILGSTLGLFQGGREGI